MIKEIAWNVFKETGNVNTFLELKQIENIEKLKTNPQKVETNGYNKNEGNNNCGK